MGVKSDIFKCEDEIKIFWIAEYHANDKKQQEDLTSVFVWLQLKIASKISNIIERTPPRCHNFVYM